MASLKSHVHSLPKWREKLSDLMVAFPEGFKFKLRWWQTKVIGPFPAKLLTETIDRGWSYRLFVTDRCWNRGDFREEASITRFGQQGRRCLRKANFVTAATGASGAAICKGKLLVRLHEECL